MLRSILAVITGYVVTYFVGFAANMLIGLTFGLLLAAPADGPGSARIAVMWAGMTLAAFVGGFAAADIGRTRPVRHAGALGALLVALVVPTMLRRSPGTALWYPIVFAGLRGVGATLGGLVRARLGWRAIAPQGTGAVAELGARDARISQLLLAVVLLVTSTVVTVFGGHGAMALGLALFLSPSFAVVGASIIIGVIAAALKLDARLFAVCCSLAVLPIFAFVVMTWSTEGFQPLSLRTALPLVASWLAIVARAVFTPTAVRA